MELCLVGCVLLKKFCVLQWICKIDLSAQPAALRALRALLRRHAERGHAVGAVEGSLSVGLGPHSCRHFALADRDTLNGPVSCV